MKTVIKALFSLILMTTFISTFAQKKTQNFTVTYEMNAPADKVWAVVGEDFGAIANSHPQIVSSEYINGTLKSGEGAERVCNFNDKGTKYLQEKQVNYDPENYRFEVQVSQASKLPMDPNYSLAVYKVEPIDENSSRFIFEMTYRTKPAFMGAMAKGKFRKLIEDYALAIEHHVNTGEIVNQDNFKEIKKQRKG